MMIRHKRYFQTDISIQTTQLYDYVRTDSTEQFSRQVRFWKGHAFHEQTAEKLPAFCSYIQFHLLPCAQHAFALPVQRLRRRSCLPFVVFLTPFSDSLGPWSSVALWKVLKMRNRRNCSWPFFWGVWKLWRNISVQSWCLQNRSEPFRRSAEPFRTVLETSALRKVSRKWVLCAKNPGNRKARTRLSNSGCISPNLKVTHHHPQEPHR